MNKIMLNKIVELITQPCFVSSPNNEEWSIEHECCYCWSIPSQ